MAALKREPKPNSNPSHISTQSNPPLANAPPEPRQRRHPATASMGARCWWQEHDAAGAILRGAPSWV